MIPRFTFALITVILVVSSSVQAETKPALRAGAAAVDITPQQGVSLDGPISKNGPVTGVHDPLKAHALVLDDGTTRFAIVICDLCIIGPDVYEAAKQIVTKKTGLPNNRMLMAATHTHATPRANHIGTGKLDDEYHTLLATKIAEAVIKAEGNLAPAQIGWTSFQKPEFIKCRRHLCKPGTVGVNPFGETGERIKSVSGKSSAIIKPAGPVDPQFSILSVQHADGSPLAVLGNFSVHYCGGYRRGLVSADYFGYYAKELEQKLSSGAGHPPFVGIMSNGTSGNTGGIERGGKKYPPFGWIQESARILAEQTLTSIKKIQYRSDTKLQMRETKLTLGIRKPDAKRIAWAKEILANPKLKRPHRWTNIYAEDVIRLDSRPETHTIKLQAIRIGDLAIAACPCEVFAETGLAIKKHSPHKETFTIELANGYGGYLPPPEQHALGGYETWAARSSFLEVQAEPKIRETILRLLDDDSSKKAP